MLSSVAHRHEKRTRKTIQKKGQSAHSMECIRVSVQRIDKSTVLSPSHKNENEGDEEVEK